MRSVLRAMWAVVIFAFFVGLYFGHLGAESVCACP